MTFDPADPAGARALERLRTDEVGWLTTVRPDGQPVSMPIWFLWDGAELLVYSHRTARRNGHILANPKVSLHLDTDADGGDLVIIHGEASIDRTTPSLADNPAYLAKYGVSIEAQLGSVGRMAEDYDVPIRIRVAKAIAGDG